MDKGAPQAPQAKMVLTVPMALLALLAPLAPLALLAPLVWMGNLLPSMLTKESHLALDQWV